LVIIFQLIPLKERQEMIKYSNEYKIYLPSVTFQSSAHSLCASSPWRSSLLN
jgi:hypothetical protein